MKKSHKQAIIEWRNLLTGEVETQSFQLKFEYDPEEGIEYDTVMSTFKAQLEEITKDSYQRKFSIGYVKIGTPKYVKFSYQYQDCNTWINPTELNITKK